MSIFRWNGRTGWPRRSQERDRLSSSPERGFSFPRSGRTHSIGWCAAIGPADQSDPYDSASHEPNPHQRGTGMLLDDRLAQIVPTLTPAQIQFALRFASGPERRFAPDEKLLDVGDRDTAVWLIVEGSIVASRRDGLGREGIFATGGPGQFSGEVSDLAGHASLAMVCAGPEGCTAYPFDLPHLRALLISSADIAELMMRAFILRRAAFLEGGGVGSVILGEAGSTDTVC